jgi:hypothetical protein
MNPKKVIKPKLTTAFGNIIERTSYEKIAVIILRIILGCALYFKFFNLINQGTDCSSLTILNSIYFSTISFTSLGYGDISPIGFGKVVASLEVLSGLISTAILVGKLASERQATLLLLIYTSGQQERISQYEKKVKSFNLSINNILDNHNHKKLIKKGLKTYAYVSAIHFYLTFQSLEAGLANFGNDTALRRLYKTLNDLQLTAYEVVRTVDIEKRIQVKFERIIRRINGISSEMLLYHTSEKSIKLLDTIQQTTSYLENWKQAELAGKAEFKYRGEPNEALLKRIRKHLPEQPWDKNTYKIIAQKLKVSNRLAERCVNMIAVRDNNTKY